MNKAEMRVSILARAEARALQKRPQLLRYDEWFQSSPAPRRGRYIGETLMQLFALQFQSSPAPRRGRYLQGR